VVVSVNVGIWIDMSGKGGDDLVAIVAGAQPANRKMIGASVIRGRNQYVASFHSKESSIQG